MGAAGTALVSVAQALSPVAAVAATHKGAMSIAQFSPTGSASGVNVVLVHGVWADGSSYSRVIPLLLDAGHTVFAVQLPLTTHMVDDVTATLGVMQQLQGPTVLVGHSYGGAVITNAGAGQPNVIGLAYASAYAPDLGDRLGQFQLGPGAANLYPVTYGALPRCAGEGDLTPKLWSSEILEYTIPEGEKGSCKRFKRPTQPSLSGRRCDWLRPVGSRLRT